MKPEDITPEIARKLIVEGLPKGIKESRAFFEGDHWQGGSAWIGPRPPVDDPNGSAVFEEIRKALVSQNAIGEIVRRHRDGVIGREPSWSLALVRPLEEGQQATEKEQSLIGEAEALLTDWWDKRSAHGALKKATANALWAGRGVLRLLVPRGQLEEGAKVPQDAPAQAAMRVWLDTPEPEQASVHEDLDTRAEVGLYSYSRDGKQRLEKQFIDSAGLTVIQVSGEDLAQQEQAGLDLGGRLELFEIKRDPLVTEQVRQLQRVMNQALTMLPRNVNLGGFLERVLFNVRLPGQEVTDSTAPSGKRFVPDEVKVGAGTVNAFVGVQTQDADGNTRIANPSIQYKDPIPVTTFKDTKEIAYTAILQETEQTHVLTNSDASASGESRKQAREGFEKSLGETKPEVDRAIRWMLETVLALTAVFSGQPGRYAGLRAVAECRLDSGARTTEEDRGVLELFNGGLLSRETAMSRIGIEDTQAEADKIAAEREAEIGAGAKRAEQAAQAEEDVPADDVPAEAMATAGNGNGAKA